MQNSLAEKSGDIDELPVQPVDVQATPVQQESVEVQEVIEAQIVEPVQDATDDFVDIMGA